MKIAGAPISWGVCEVPGWGYQLGADRVLREMREVGLIATEFGPDGFLPDDAILREAGLLAVGGFVPVVLHDPAQEPQLDLDRFVAAGLYRPIGAGDVDFVAVAAGLQRHGYDGWWVLEQDTILTAEPVGEGPVADVRRSAGRLREILG